MNTIGHPLFGDFMDKPRIFLGSSSAQAPLLEAIAAGLADVADVELWMTTFAAGSMTLTRLVELSKEVDFAAFVFAQDDWTSAAPGADAQASPRDNVVFEAGLFGGAVGMPRTFILHARGAKLPTDLLGLTSIRYSDSSEIDSIVAKLRSAIAAEGRIARIEGLWWQHSLSARSDREPSAISLLRVARDRAGSLEVTGRSWRADGTLSARYWSDAAREKHDPSGIFYFFRGERPRDADAPVIEGTGEIALESSDRAVGYFTTRSEAAGPTPARTSGVYLRADASHLTVLDGSDAAARAALIAEQLDLWKSLAE
jgi:hypothetical protein